MPKYHTDLRFKAFFSSSLILLDVHVNRTETIGYAHMLHRFNVKTFF